MSLGSSAYVRPLRELVRQRIEPVEVQEDQTYRQVTVRTRAQGIQLRGELPGAKIGTKRQFRVRVGDWLVSKIDARNGATGIVPRALDGAIVTQDFPTFEVLGDRILPSYLELVASRPSFWEECFLVSTGSTNRVRLDVDEFLDLEIAVPSITEQHTTVRRVWAASIVAERAKRERDAAFNALASAIEELIVPHGSWDELPAGWKQATLGEVADVRSGITKGRKTRDPVRPRPFLRAANVQNGWLDLSEIKTIETTDAEAERFALVDGDILMVEGSGSPDRLGRGWIWRGEIRGCLHQNHVFRARCDAETVLPAFVAYLLSSSPARQHFLDSIKTTSGLATINQTQVRALALPVPPLAEQRRIVEVLDAIRGVGTAAYRAWAASRDARASLLDRLLAPTGAQEPAPDALEERAA